MNQINFEPELATARTKLDSNLSDLVQLRPLPAVAMQIMKACDNPKTKVGELVGLIECDAAIASRILSVVNSSTYGYSREVTSINQAVVVLGFKSLSQLAVSIASEKVFSEGDAALESRLRLYEHSLATAAVSRLLATATDIPADPGAAFLAGVLHDVGKLILYDVAPDYYSNLQSNDQADELVSVETAAFGVDHSAIGAKFGSLWGLPPEINSAIANHHCVGENCEPVLNITTLSNELTKVWGVGQSANSTSCETANSWLAELDEETAGTLQEQAHSQFTELKSLLTS